MAPKFMDLGALVVYSPSAVAEVVVQLAITHSSMPVELMPASALNVEDVGSMILPEGQARARPCLPCRLLSCCLPQSAVHAAASKLLPRAWPRTRHLTSVR
jgi:hypothetical protein